MLHFPLIEMLGFTKKSYKSIVHKLMQLVVYHQIVKFFLL